MFSVRIDKDGDGYVFRAQPCDGSLEMIAMDSAPGIIAMVHADDPGVACALAWRRALHMHDGDLMQLLSPEAAVALEAGLASAARGEVAPLGSFAQYADESEDEP